MWWKYKTTYECSKYHTDFLNNDFESISELWIYIDDILAAMIGDQDSRNEQVLENYMKSDLKSIQAHFSLQQERFSI